MTSRRPAICWIAAAYAVFVVYGSLIPWQLQAQPLDLVVLGFLGLGASSALRLSWPDVGTNVAIYAVLAALWCACRSSRCGPAASRLRGSDMWVVVVGSVLFSACIEFFQLFFPPRTSSVYDLAANSAGGALGLVLWLTVGQRFATDWGRVPQSVAAPQWVDANHRRLARLLALPYLLALAVANHWWSKPWLTLSAAMHRLADVNLLPFANHQQAATTVALASVAWQLGCYAPLGAGLRVAGRSIAFARSTAMATAVLMEGGRLFIAGQLPDPGNVIVAILGAWIGHSLWPMAREVAARLRRWRGPALTIRHATPASAAVAVIPAVAAGNTPRVAVLRAAALALAALVCWGVSRYPVLPGLLAAAFLAYARVLSRWPWAWLWALPAALPVLDLAPLTGWFFLDEFDLAVLIAVAMNLWQVAGSAGVARPAMPGRTAWLLLGVSLLISGLRGLWPLPPLDANAFSSYYSHFNSLRIAKGFAGAWALIALLQALPISAAAAQRQVSGGIVLGLAGATALTLWERCAYPGVFDFSSVHRVGAFFSSMHNGGSHIEAYLTMAVPFLLVRSWLARSAWARLAGLLLFVAVTYALLVTYARGGYAAYALAVTLTLGLLLRGGLGARPKQAAVALAVTALVAAGVTGAVLSGAFAQQRLSATGVDLQIRDQHWREALGMMDEGPWTALVGMGLGRFPETYFYRHRDERPLASFRYAAEAGRSHLTLGHGQAVYVEQFVGIEPQQAYQLSMNLRSRGGPSRLNVLLCARTYFMSYGCESVTFDTARSGSDWNRMTATVQSHQLGSGPWWLRRPIKLSLENAAPGTQADVRDISLTNADGHNLVVNGDFSQGSDRWFFSSNFNHLPWHIKNLAVGLYFDQGLLGVVALTALLASALSGLARAAWAGQALAAAALAAAMGFLMVGLFDSLFDAPRLTLMWLLLLAAFHPGLKADTMSAPLPRSSPSGAPPAAAPVGRPSAANSAPASRSTAWRVGLGVVLVALAIVAVSRAPGVPYNLRALLNPLHPLLAPVALSLVLFWVLGLPALLARQLEFGQAARWLLPVALVLHAALSWLLLREAVLPVMIHKVTGYPVLGWPSDWETLGRYVALHSAFVLPLIGGCLLQHRLMGRTRSTALLVWLAWCSVLLPVLHHLIVKLAATDNLVELMADGGAGWAAATLALWVLLVGVTGAWLADPSSALAGRLIVGLASVPMGYGLLWLGLDAAVDKYGISFSGLQFLLSASRQHYAEGTALVLRYIVAHGAVLALIVLAQRPWRLTRQAQ